MPRRKRTPKAVGQEITDYRYDASGRSSRQPHGLPGKTSCSSMLAISNLATAFPLTRLMRISYLYELSGSLRNRFLLLSWDSRAWRQRKIGSGTKLSGDGKGR